MTAHGECTTQGSSHTIRVAEVRPRPRGVRAPCLGACADSGVCGVHVYNTTGISSHASWSCFIHISIKTTDLQENPGGLDNASSLSMAAKRASALAAHTYYLAAPLAAPPHELPDLLPDLLAIWVATLPLVLQLCPALLAPLRP